MGACSGRCGPDDLTGEVFRVAFDARVRYAPGVGAVRPWLYGIAANLVRRQLRDDNRADRAWNPLSAETASDDIDQLSDRLDALRAHISADRSASDPARPVGRRRRMLIGGAIAAATLAAGGTVAANGLLDRQPAELVKRTACNISAGDARLVATAVDSRSTPLQLWMVDSTNGFANLVVETAPDGGWLGSTMGCGPIARAESFYGSGGAWAEGPVLSDDEATLVRLYGWIPAPATEATVTLTDGTTVTVQADTEGYFLHPLTRPPETVVEVAEIVTEPEPAP